MRILPTNSIQAQKHHQSSASTSANELGTNTWTRIKCQKPKHFMQHSHHLGFLFSRHFEEQTVKKTIQILSMDRTAKQTHRVSVSSFRRDEHDELTVKMQGPQWDTEAENSCSERVTAGSGIGGAGGRG